MDLESESNELAKVPFHSNAKKCTSESIAAFSRLFSVRQRSSPSHDVAANFCGHTAALTFRDILIRSFVLSRPLHASHAGRPCLLNTLPMTSSRNDPAQGPPPTYFTCTLGEAAILNARNPHPFQTVPKLLLHLARHYSEHGGVGFFHASEGGINDIPSVYGIHYSSIVCVH